MISRLAITKIDPAWPKSDSGNQSKRKFCINCQVSTRQLTSDQFSSLAVELIRLLPEAAVKPKTKRKGGCASRMGAQQAGAARSEVLPDERGDRGQRVVQPREDHPDLRGRNAWFTARVNYSVSFFLGENACFAAKMHLFRSVANCCQG